MKRNGTPGIPPHEHCDEGFKKKYREQILSWQKKQHMRNMQNKEQYIQRSIKTSVYLEP